MNPSFEDKLSTIRERHKELAALMADPETVTHADQFARCSREYAALDPVVRTFQAWRAAICNAEAAEALLNEPDIELRALAQEDLASSHEASTRLRQELEALLMPRDPEDEAPAFLEIRAGTGGDEAALFAGDLLRMYLRYAEQQGWHSELLSERPGEVGGCREIITRLVGKGVYGRLKFESGAHRVQRIPVTESSGRIHTSACTVAVLPEPESITAVEFAREDLRIDTFRASGAGGQHVNKTDSAVRILHRPTGIVVECQDERSQHKNRARGLALLQARLNDLARQRADAERAGTRRNLIGSGDRSERIRTYNFPQGRVTDHRINLTLYNLDAILEGELDQIITPLMREHQTDLLARL